MPCESYLSRHMLTSCKSVPTRAVASVLLALMSSRCHPQARKCSAVVFLKGLVKGVERELSMRAELTHG